MDIKKEFLEKVDKTNNQISTSPIIKGLIDGFISLVPFLGSAISSSLDTRAFQLFEENSKRFAEETREILEKLEEKKIDKNFLESKEFTSLLIEILAHNARTYEKEKVKLFAKLFVGFSTIEGASLNYKEGFIRIVDELSVEHIKILSSIYNRTIEPLETDERLKDRIRVVDIASEISISPENVQASCDQMIRYGLLRDWSLGKFGYKVGNFALTPYGFKFANFLLSFGNLGE